MGIVSFRDGEPADNYTAFRIFEQTVGDLARRNGISQRPAEQDLQEAENNWPKMSGLYEHLAHTAEYFVLAEVENEVIGYARSILRDGVRELTEFFVLPGQQSAGIGRALLERVFPKEGATHRVVIATTDPRALVRYLKAGVYARFPIYNFSRAPRDLPPPEGLRAQRLSDSADDLAGLAEIDQAILGYTRPEDHHFWLEERAGYFYEQDGRRIGYGYSGYDGGPFALLDASCYPAVLAHAENAAARAFDRFHLEVPLINQAAVDYLLAQGYEMSAFTTLFMSDRPLGRCENYILPAPPFSL
jgi:GNAT superfamily N-acetyltransferase